MDFLTYIERLARCILSDSLELSKGDWIVVEGIDVPSDWLVHFADVFKSNGIKPVLLTKSNRAMVFNNNLESEELLKYQVDYELSLLKKAKAFIGLRYPQSLNEMSALTSTARNLVLNHFVKPVHFDFRNNNLQWLYFRLPSKALLGETNYEKLAEGYFGATLIPYKKLNQEMRALEILMQRTKLIQIKGEGVDLNIALSGSGVYKSTGQHNLPDGEIFCSPMRDGMNGFVNFNVPTTYLGNHFNSVALEFKNGCVVRADAESKTNLLNEILDTDDGARYCGEWALGLNPFVTEPINDILYDEKMAGSFHLALGNAYPMADNKNRSVIHWDLIFDMRKTDVEMLFDNTLIMKGGQFIPNDLISLNPQNLKELLELS